MSPQPSGSTIVDDPRVANMVMQGPLLIVKSGDDVTDRADQLAEDFRATPAKRAAITDLAAARIHHGEFEHHLTRCRAEFAEEKCRINRADRNEYQLKQQTEGLGDNPGLAKDDPRAGTPAGPLRINRRKSSEVALRGSRGGQTQSHYEYNQRNKHDDANDEAVDELGSKANPKAAIFLRAWHAGAFLEPLQINRFARAAHPAFANRNHFIPREHLAALPANDLANSRRRRACGALDQGVRLPARHALVPDQRGVANRARFREVAQFSVGDRPALLSGFGVVPVHLVL